MSYSDKDHVPKASKLLESLLSNHWNELGIKIQKADTVFRYLVSKVIYSEDKLSEAEKVALFSSYEIMVNKAAVDEMYHKKHFWWLFITRSLVQSLNGELVDQKLQNLKKAIADLTSHGRGYFSGSIYYGLKIKTERLYAVWIRTRFPVKTRERNRIAVGYRDKGHLKKASDGTPHWSEVAMELGEHASVSSSKKKDDLWSTLKIHPEQVLNL